MTTTKGKGRGTGRYTPGLGRYARRWGFTREREPRGKQWRRWCFWAIELGRELGRFPGSTRDVLSFLVDRGGDHGSPVTLPSAEIAAHLGLGVSTVRWALCWLRESGWLDWHHRVERLSNGQLRQLPNCYIVHVPDDVEQLRQERVKAGRKPKPALAGTQLGAGGGRRGPRPQAGEAKQPHYDDWTGSAGQTAPPTATPDEVRRSLASARRALHRPRAPD